MRTPSLKNRNLACLLFSMALGCSTSPFTPAGHGSKFERIAIGDGGEKVKELWGPPEVDQESYGKMKITTLNFLKPDGAPDAFFSVDESGRVVGKAQWIYSSGFAELEKVIAGRFKDSSWKTYIPCRTRGERDKILVDHDRNLAVDMASNGIGLISWSTPELLSARIELILKTCPNSQAF